MSHRMNVDRPMVVGTWTQMPKESILDDRRGERTDRRDGSGLLSGSGMLGEAVTRVSFLSKNVFTSSRGALGGRPSLAQEMCSRP